MASASSSSPSPSPTTARGAKKYDVFISFRGEETRNTVTGILYGRLHWEYHVNVFMDGELDKGSEISPSLMEAIEESIISVIVFSQGYASSRWCLEELVKIMECKKTCRQIVIPVFFHVDPSHVRNQTGNFGDGFAKLVEGFNKEKLEKRQMTKEQFTDKVQAWRNSMTEAANLSGYTATHTTSLYGLTQKIARDILEMLNYLSSQVDNNDLVGIKTSIDYIIKYLLRLDDDKLIRDVHTVGIWGMGGIGKTTTAEAVFNIVRTKFEASYFALNVREKSSNRNTLALLRQDFLSTILNDWHSNINFTNSTKWRLGSKKVVIVFDDVTCFSQIEFLIGDLNCLGSGSRIIITTRNKQVLRNCGVEERSIYKIEGLSHCGALNLFSRYAFRQSHPKNDYDELSDRVVQYAKGVPLALKVLGSFLLDKPKEVWESAINKLEIIPHEEIQDVLKVSYDGLDDIEKNIFLDIACFLKWENRDFAIDFLDACGFYAKLGISVLIDKCLITISNDNQITMHDLLQEMGWEIVRQESTKDPGDRSRLWHHEDICKVLEENMGTKAIEGICFDMSKEREIIQIQPCALAMMHKLRFFKLHNTHHEGNNINKVNVSQGLNFVSTELRYLCWHGFPLKSLRLNFRPKNLIALDLPHSNIEQLWLCTQLIKLKHIDLSYSKHLREIQDFSLVPNLESLILEGCTNLFEVSSSIQCLNKLAILNLRHCKSLHSLPPCIHLESLKKVILSCCTNLKMLPEFSCNIEELYVDETAIKELAPSIENLSRLVTLNLKNCTKLENLPSNICMLKSLQHLNISGCSNLDGLPDNLGNLEALKMLEAESVGKNEVVPSSSVYLQFLVELNLINCCIKELPNNLGQLSSLDRLLLGRNNFESIPTSIVHLSKLSYLDISYCERLQSLPELPCQLQIIDAHSCTSLEVSSGLSILFSRDISQGARVNFSNCSKLVYQNAFKETVKDVFLKFDRRMSKSFVPRHSACICFPGNEIPEWFIFQSRGSSITLDLPRYFDSTDLVDLIMCAVVEFRNYCNEGQSLAVGCYCRMTGRNANGTEGQSYVTLKGWDYGAGPKYVDLDHVLLGYDFPCVKFLDVCRYRKLTIQFYVENFNTESVHCCKVIKCGVWGPKLYLPKMEEEQDFKRVKFSNLEGGGSSSRENVKNQ